LVENFKPQTVNLRLQAINKYLEFIKRDGATISSIKYWIPPREYTMADNNWLDIKGYANKWGFKTENSEDKMCFGVNKWLMAHPDAPEIKDGAYEGILGKNIDYKDLEK
jgi:hypothetical protein